MMKNVMCMGNRNSKSCFFDFLETAGISLPFRAIVGRSGSRLRLYDCVSAVIGLFCRQYDIIKDNDSNNNPKEKGKGPEQSPQGRPVGTRQVMWGQ